MPIDDISGGDTIMLVNNSAVTVHRVQAAQRMRVVQRRCELALGWTPMGIPPLHAACAKRERRVHSTVADLLTTKAPQATMQSSPAHHAAYRYEIQLVDVEVDEAQCGVSGRTPVLLRLPWNTVHRDRAREKPCGRSRAYAFERATPGTRQCRHWRDRGSRVQAAQAMLRNSHSHTQLSFRTDTTCSKTNSELVGACSIW